MSVSMGNMVGTTTKYVITECCKAPVRCTAAYMDMLVLVLVCNGCGNDVGLPGTEDIEDAQR